MGNMNNSFYGNINKVHCIPYTQCALIWKQPSLIMSTDMQLSGKLDNPEHNQNSEGIFQSFSIAFNPT